MQINNRVTGGHRRSVADAFKVLVLLLVLILGCNRGALSIGTNLMAGFVMRSSETHKGNSIVSLGELRCRKTVPDLAWKQYRRAVAEDDEGHYWASFRLATSAATLWPAFPQVHTALALWYLRNHDLPNAQVEVGAALNLNAHYLPATELLGAEFLLRGALSDARKTLAWVVVEDPTRELAQYLLSQTLSELGESKLAKEHLEAANRLNRHRPRPVLPDSEVSPRLE